MFSRGCFSHRHSALSITRPSPYTDSQQDTQLWVRILSVVPKFLEGPERDSGGGGEEYGHVSYNDNEPTEVGPHLRDETCHPTVAQSFSNFSGHTNPPGILLKSRF